MTLTIPRPLERDVQRQITALFRSVGGVVRSNSQYRASGVSLGFPDLHVSFPKIGDLQRRVKRIEDRILSGVPDAR